MAIRDITLGQYYPAESAVHRLDPRTKILGTLVFLVSLFLVNNFTGFAFAAMFLAIVIRISGIPFRFMSRGLKPIIFLIVLTVAINMFSTPGTVIWSWWKLSLTYEGVLRAVFMALRLVMLIFGSSLLSLTTKPIQLTDGMEAYLAPFAKIGLPSHEIAMMLSIALRFIPTLLEETDKIMKAQTARGADFESGRLRDRARALVPLLVPLFVSAFRIAGDLAMAMEARCYHGGKGRTRMNGMKFGRSDLVAVIILVLFVSATLVIRKLPVF